MVSLRSGSLIALFLFYGDGIFLVLGVLGGLQNYHWTHSFFFFCAESDTFNLELNLAVMGGEGLITHFLQVLCSIWDPGLFL